MIPADLLILASSPLVQTFGRLHVAMVHFPVALLILAGVLEGWRLLVRRQSGVSPTAVTCAVLGAIAAVLAAAMGWILARDSDPTPTLFLHRWFGVSTAIVAVATALLLLAGRRSTKAVFAFGIGSLLCAGMVGLTGHFGGELTYGQGYLTELLLGSPDEKPEPSPATEPTQKISLSKVDYEKDVRPILDSSCVDCHGPNKIRGGLRLDNGAFILKGGNAGPSFIAHDPDKSLIFRRVQGLDGKKRMPIDKPPLTPTQVAILKAWITQGGAVGDVKSLKTWIAKVEPREVPLPPSPSPDITNPIDRLLASYLTTNGVPTTSLVPDRVYARRVYLDTIGLLPTPAQLSSFEQDPSPDKRAALVSTLLSENRPYAEHWLSFWNDALRNDYSGPGYIDGGRKAITNFLYTSLASNTPYNKFVTQLINPTPESEGFTKGIIWRGAVSASQIPELQASQNICQVFLGINMKCASCHDSFISEWKLADAYGLAGVYADKPMVMYRCEKDTGKKAPVKFLYPQLGSIDLAAPKSTRLAQLASALTSKQDGRFTRTIVNRLWARFLGHGIVEPLDEMDNEPWSPDLLDFLASDLVSNNYDLKHTINLILTSRAYQLPTAGMPDPNAKSFTFTGPVVRRLSAEQFSDAISQITGVWQQSPAARPPDDNFLAGYWIWNTPSALSSAVAGTIYLRKEFTLDSLPEKSLVAGTCDNRFTLYINGKKITSSTDWTKPGIAQLKKQLVIGKNVIAIEATNDSTDNPNATNPAALWACLSMKFPADPKTGKTTVLEIPTDGSWVSSPQLAHQWDTLSFDASSWRPAVALAPATAVGPYNLIGNLAATNKPYSYHEGNYRAVWAKNDRLMSALGRPSREQTVTYRISTATTLQALELTNGPELFDTLKLGAIKWSSTPSDSDTSLITQIYQTTLGRSPTPSELAASQSLLPPNSKQQGIEDLLWSLVMLPEFQLIY